MKKVTLEIIKSKKGFSFLSEEKENSIIHQSNKCVKKTDQKLKNKYVNFLEKYLNHHKQMKCYVEYGKNNIKKKTKKD